jgi:hypothetical protein
MQMGLKTGLNHIRRRHKLQDKFKAPDITNLNEQLSLLGLKIHPVTADGNCFYRAVADQLEGNEEAHGKYRHLAVDYIQVFCKIFDLCTSRTSKIISRLLIGCQALCFLWIRLLTLPFGALKIRSDAQATSRIGQCLCFSTSACWGIAEIPRVI